MSSRATNNTQRAQLEFNRVCYRTDFDRTLFQDLNLVIAGEHIAVVGRNGVGKSTLLKLMAEKLSATSGVISRRAEVSLCSQSAEVDQTAQLLQWLTTDSGLSRQMLEHELATAGLPVLAALSKSSFLSRGEIRKLQLLQCKLSDASLLLLDEPTQDLDNKGSSWLRKWISNWKPGLIVASHDAELLTDFQHFFILAEAGCRYFKGTFEELNSDLEQRRHAGELAYARTLQRLVEEEEHTPYRTTACEKETLRTNQ